MECARRARSGVCVSTGLHKQGGEGRIYSRSTKIRRSSAARATAGSRFSLSSAESDTAASSRTRSIFSTACLQREA